MPCYLLRNSSKFAPIMRLLTGHTIHSLPDSRVVLSDSQEEAPNIITKFLFFTLYRSVDFYSTIQPI